MVNERFNSATAVTPWMTLSADRRRRERSGVLQFGHGGDAVDDLPLASLEAQATHRASIRPRR